jgi:hypothetical protein
MGKYEQIDSIPVLIDAIVRMRENRDGLIETPEQFLFVAKILKLNNFATCGINCKVRYFWETGSEVTLKYCALLSLGYVFFLIIKKIFHCFCLQSKAKNSTVCQSNVNQKEL